MSKNPIISVSATLTLAGYSSIEDAPFKKNVSWEAGRELSVVRPVGTDGWWPYKPQPRRLARLRFTGSGVEVVFESPEIAGRRPEPSFVAAVEALRAEVARLPAPEVGWTVETGSSSDQGWWSALTAPDGRRWALLERYTPRGLNAWTGVVPGPMVAPEGTLDFTPATMKGDFSSGPFSKDYPAYRVEPAALPTPFMRYVDAWKEGAGAAMVAQKEDAAKGSPMWAWAKDYPTTPVEAWEGNDCGDWASIVMKARLNGRNAPARESREVELEINRYWVAKALAALDSELKWASRREPTSDRLPDFSYMSGGKPFYQGQPSDTVARRLVESIGASIRREPTAEEWAAAGFPVA